MMGFLASLAGLKWKLISGGAAAMLVVASLFLLKAQMDNRHLVKQVAQLDARINAPTVGYVAKLAQANTNVATLEGAVDRQNTALRTQAAASAKSLGVLSAQVANIQRENLTLKAQAARMLATKPQGSTITERITDIDQRVLETLQ